MAGAEESRLRVDGRFLARGDERVFLKGVTFGPFPAGEELVPADEFPRLASCGFNAVRVYDEPDEALLDLAAANDLVVLAGRHWEWTRDFLQRPALLTEAALRLVDFAKRLGSHPALGALLVANEIPPDLTRWMGPVEVRDVLEELIAACQAEVDDLLVAYANYPSTEYLEPRNADFTAFNIYLEERAALHRYLPRLQNIAGDRPVVITEFGLDTIHHSEAEQAEVLQWHLDECLAAGIAGTTLFAWSDRWVSGERKVDDWAFGLTRENGSEKPALAALRKTLPGIGNHRDAVALEDPPRISVVVCTRNNAHILPDCLAACLAIDYPDYEVVVVDDGSTDATAQVVTRTRGVRYEYQEHAGLSVARNYGAELATGDIIAYTDDDCEPDRDWLFWLARAYDDPKVGAAGGPNLPPPPEGLQEAVVAAAPGAPSHVLLDDLRAEHLPGCNLSLSRQAFEEVTGFRARFTTAGDDVDLCWRLMEAGWELAFSPAAFVWHRRRPSFLPYLRQQGGYGRAEALLFEAHPERFDACGIRWEGSLYGGGAVSPDPHAVIYFGALGGAPYQGLQTHAMPRREVDPHFAGFWARGMLKLAEFAQPWSRALARWRHGGPRPSFLHRDSNQKVYRDELRKTVELTFEGGDPQGRESFLTVLEGDGWQRCDDTERWDLERSPFRILTATEQYGPLFHRVLVRLQYPPAMRFEAISELSLAALEAGLTRR